MGGHRCPQKRVYPEAGVGDNDTCLRRSKKNPILKGMYKEKKKKEKDERKAKN